MRDQNISTGFFLIVLTFVLLYIFSVMIYEPAISKNSKDHINWIECKINDRCQSVEKWNFLSDNINEAWAFAKDFEKKNPNFPWFLIINDDSVEVYTKKEIFEHGDRLIVPSFLVNRFECRDMLIPCVKRTIKKLKSEY